MTQEEKAKAYDEAKLRMSAAYNSNRCTIGFMNEIFPELKESEDERIKKELKLAKIEQNPAWSEDDERIYKVVLELIDSYSKGTIGGCIISPNTDRYIKWLKSLKYRVKPKPKHRRKT